MIYEFYKPKENVIKAIQYKGLANCQEVHDFLGYTHKDNCDGCTLIQFETWDGFDLHLLMIDNYDK